MVKVWGDTGVQHSDYFKKLDLETNNLPRFLARIRTGNDEEIRFFKDVEAKMGFLQSHDLAEQAQESNFHKEIEKDGILMSQRISIHEIFESKELERLIALSTEIGINKEFFSDEKSSSYSLITDNEDETIELTGVKSLSRES